MEVVWRCSWSKQVGVTGKTSRLILTIDADVTFGSGRYISYRSWVLVLGEGRKEKTVWLWLVQVCAVLYHTVICLHVLLFFFTSLWHLHYYHISSNRSADLTTDTVILDISDSVWVFADYYVLAILSRMRVMDFFVDEFGCLGLSWSVLVCIDVCIIIYIASQTVVFRDSYRVSTKIFSPKSYKI